MVEERHDDRTCRSYLGDGCRMSEVGSLLSDLLALHLVSQSLHETKRVHTVATNMISKSHREPREKWLQPETIGLGDYCVIGDVLKP